MVETDMTVTLLPWESNQGGNKAKTGHVRGSEQSPCDTPRYCPSATAFQVQVGKLPVCSHLTLLYGSLVKQRNGCVRPFLFPLPSSHTERGKAPRQMTRQLCEGGHAGMGKKKVK
jgi:hypothetical protein